MIRFLFIKGISFFAFSLAALVYFYGQDKIDILEKKKKGLRILFIGDSNTEIGNITMPFKAILDSIYGDYGTGFCTLNPNSMGKIPDGLTVSCDSNWAGFDMRNDFKPEPAPYYSPNGLSISSSTPGAVVTIHFSGEAINLFYLKAPQGGNFSVTVDSNEKAIIKQQASSYSTKKIEYKNLSAGKHVAMIKVVSGNVTLLGVDAKKGNEKEDQRYILHKWGNAWASSEDFINTDKKVFITAIRELNPDKVVILLGTNDHNLDHRGADDFKFNLKKLVNRIKKTLPHAGVLIVSTFSTDGEESKTILTSYLVKSFPEAAKETHSSYWNMNEWFGPYDPGKIQDGVHVNETYGKLIAAELFKHLR